MKRLFFSIVAFFFFVTLISCKNKYDFRKSRDAADQIVEEIKNKRVVFLGDNHSNVLPVLFLTENLEKFYEAGVRFIFLEEQSDGYIENPERINFFVYPPWCKFGYKFEYIKFEEEIKRINKIHENDPLIPIWPETGLVIEKDVMEDDNYVMNIRDSYAEKRIIEILDKYKKKKGIVFYGDAHGRIIPSNLENDENSDGHFWLPLGGRLRNHFENDFSNFAFFSLSSDDENEYIYTINSEYKIIPEKYVTKMLKNKGREYDYYCTSPLYKEGIPIYYVAQTNVIEYMMSLLASGIDLSEETDVWSAESEKLLAVYYLKYHLGEAFRYDYRFPDADLIKHVDLKDYNFEIEKTELYMEYLNCYGYIEDYLYYENKDSLSKEEKLEVIPIILAKLSQASELNSKDIWPCYWMCYFSMEQAVCSGNRDDFCAVLDLWENLLANDLLYASPVVKLVYRKISFCYDKLGNSSMCKYYNDKADGISIFRNFDYKRYIYFGW